MGAKRAIGGGDDVLKKTTHFIAKLQRCYNKINADSID